MNVTQRLLIAVLIPFTTFAIQLALWDFIDPYVWFLFYPGVFFSAVLAGLYGGILATLLSTLLVWYVFVPPRFTFAVEKPSLYIPIIGFMLTGIVFSLFSERMRRQSQRVIALESDAKLNKVIDSAADAIFITNPQGQYIYVNAQASALLGYSSDELLHLSIPDITVPGEMTLIELLLQQLRDCGRTRADIHLRRKDGTFIAVEINATMLPDGNLFGACRDMTELMESKMALQKIDERYTAAFQASTDAINISRLSDGVYLDVNDAFLSVMGFKHDEVIGRSSLELDIWDDPTDRSNLVEELKRNGRCQNFECRFRKKNGDLLWGSMSAVVMELDETPCLLSITRVITDIKLAHEELARYRNHLEQLVLERTAALSEANAKLIDTQFAMESVGIGIHWVDVETGDILYMNEFAAKMLGYESEDVIKLNIQEIDPRFSEVSFKQEAKRLQHEGRAQFETTLLTKDGRSIPVEVTLYYQPRRENINGRFISFVTNITQRKADERALLKAKEAAETANIAKSAFLANMSHEIRTPLNAITGMAHLIKRSGISAEQARRLDKIDIAGQHLLEIINAILDLSKIEAGKFVLEESEVKIQAIVGNISAMILDKVQARGLILLFDIELPTARLLGDPTRLQQALLNYATNAVKFTESGNITIRLRVQAEDSESVLIRFEVQDTGIGIAPEILPKLFSTFEQADNSITRKYGGTGLGLAITKKFAQLMGGNAGADSVLGIGSTFWFSARLKKCKALPDDLPGYPIRSAENTLKRDYRGCRILLVEDEPINCEVALTILEECLLSVDCAKDGTEAVELVGQNEYDLILMDMQMPKKGGLEATQDIRCLPNGNEVPIIAMTANAFVEDKQRCLQAGMNDFIAKPVDPEVLFSTLVKWFVAKEKR